MKTPKIKFFMTRVKFTLIFLSICCLIMSVFIYYKKDFQETKDSPFFTKLLFLDHLAYTLHGSKPITEVSLLRNQDLLQDDNEGATEKEDRFTVTIDCDFEKEFDEWLSSLDQQKIKNFIILKQKDPSGNFEFVYFINIIERAKTLQKHYPYF